MDTFCFYFSRSFEYSRNSKFVWSSVRFRSRFVFVFNLVSVLVSFSFSFSFRSRFVFVLVSFSLSFRSRFRFVVVFVFVSVLVSFAFSFSFRFRFRFVFVLVSFSFQTSNPTHGLLESLLGASSMYQVHNVLLFDWKEPSTLLILLIRCFESVLWYYLVFYHGTFTEFLVCGLMLLYSTQHSLITKTVACCYDVTSWS